LGAEIPGRQLPQVDPHAASMGCPQLGQGCSTAADEPAGRFSLRAAGGPAAERAACAETPGLRTGPEPLCLGRDCRPPPASHCFSLSNTRSWR
jgi:hypothetical protein